ncbi:hypothetical protein BH23ACT2_BH23ACT2_01600 [soil metagenome]
MTSTAELARQVAFVATDLDRRQYPFAPVVRQAARLLLDLTDHSDNGCRGCGAELPQPVTGGRRLWCGETCRRRHRR